MHYLLFDVLEHGSTAGLTDAELLGIQKVDDALALNMVNGNELLALRNASNAANLDELSAYFHYLVHRIIINWLYLHLILCQPIQLPPDLFHRACMSNGKLPALC